MIQKSADRRHISNEMELEFDEDDSDKEDNGDVDMEADDQGPRSAMKSSPNK